MKTPDEKAKKILLALELASQNLAASNLALSLANRLQAELIGLFVEDEDLLLSTQFPFSSEVIVGSALERKLEYSDLERSLRAWFTQMQNQLSKQAQQANIKCSFQSFRGHKTETLLKQTTSSTVLVISGLRTGRYVAHDQAQAIYVLVDDESELDHSLIILNQLIIDGARQIVFIDSGEESSKNKIANAIPLLSEFKVDVHSRMISQQLVQELFRMTSRLPAAVVLVPSSHCICGKMYEFNQLQIKLSCPVVVIS